MINKSLSVSNLKSTDTAYLCWFILGSHYAYLGKWGLQFLFWLTIGGFGIWALVDLFLMSKKVESTNAPIFKAIEEIQNQRNKDRAEQLAMMTEMN
jgi:hypothetical protein